MERASDTGGVKPMSIAGRLTNVRERTIGMTDAERAFRKQWLQDQLLSPNEPKHVPEIYKEMYNPVRRFYRWPMDQLEKALTPTFGALKAKTFRYTTAKIVLSVCGFYWMYYYQKYHGNDWTRKYGMNIMMSRLAVAPGDPGYPTVSTKNKGSDYATRGFDKFTLDI